MYQKTKTESKNSEFKSSRSPNKMPKSEYSRTEIIDVLIGMAKDIKKLLEIIEERENTRKGY